MPSDASTARLLHPLYVPAHHPLYLDTAADVASFVASIAGDRAIALDTEGASFHRFVDRIYLLQLSTREHTAVIDPLPVGVPIGLGALLEDPAVEVVFHDADYDLRLLHQDYGWHVTSIFDTRIAAQLLGLRSFGLGALLERYLGVRLDKKHQRADWSMRPLSQDMLDYAAQDTMHLLELRGRLKDELEGKGRWQWAAEEFGRLEGTRWAEEDDPTAWMRIKGARDLSRRELALLRELLAWRAAAARAADRATFRIIGNDALFEIARTAPVTRDALARIKGVPRGIMERAGDEILAAVRRGVEVADDELPRFPRGQRWERDPDFDRRAAALRTVRDAAAQRLELDPGVLCSRDRLEIIARRKPDSIEELSNIPELRRWQVEVLGDAFLRALRSESGAPAPTAPDAQDFAGEQRAEQPSEKSDEDSPYRDG